MASALQHRGPDYSDIWSIPTKGNAEGQASLFIGHSRLSILDLSSNGHQPMQSADGKVFLVYNGEIYNFITLREKLIGLGQHFRSQSDTEVLLNAYCQWGPEFVSHLEGMFAFAIWDARHQSLLLGRDRLGIKPLCYYFDQKTLVFSSEMKALMKVPLVKREIDREAVADFFQLRYLPDCRTVLLHTTKVAPGSLVQIGPTDIQENQYWSLGKPGGQDALINQESAASACDSLLTSVIQDHLIADVPVGCFLSGGIDSSLIAAIAAKQSGNRFQTFTIGFEDEAFDESPIAKRAADHFGSAHHTQIISNRDMTQIVENLYQIYDEPFGDSSALAMVSLTRFASQHVKTCLSGDGGDELFHGYLWYQQLERLWHFFQLPLSLRRLLFRAILQYRYRGTMLEGIEQKEFYRAISHGMGIFKPKQRLRLCGGEGTTFEMLTERAFGHRSPANREHLYSHLFTLGLTTWLPGDFLVKVDRASMAFGLEVRVPYLDSRMVNFARNLPLNTTRPGKIGKKLLRELAERYLPIENLHAPKKGFSIPLTKLLHSGLRDLMGDTLSADHTARYGILSPQEVSQQRDRFFANPQQETTKTWLLVNFQLWCQEHL